MSTFEYDLYKLFNASNFGTKSIRYILNNLQKLNYNINDFFNFDLNKLHNFFPEIGKGKYSRASFENLYSIDEDKISDSFKKIKEQNIKIICLNDSEYPKLVLEKLKEDAPPILFCKGYFPLLNSLSISVVGSRCVDEAELRLTKKISGNLSLDGFNIVSGYAKGVDTCAHIGALENKGTTTMVLSFGFKQFNVKRELKELEYEKNSLFISQYAYNELFSGRNAMNRNNLVCALSKAIIIISSGPERDDNCRSSGTFAAGLSALKMNIPVFVLNPEIFKSKPLGNSELINRGGIKVSSLTELLEKVSFLKEAVSCESSNVAEEDTKYENDKMKRKKTKKQKSKELQYEIQF